jgi:hypothetical protein
VDNSHSAMQGAKINHKSVWHLRYVQEVFSPAFQVQVRFALSLALPDFLDLQSVFFEARITI